MKVHPSIIVGTVALGGFMLLNSAPTPTTAEPATMNVSEDVRIWPVPPVGIGTTNPVVTQENIGQTICVSGWTATQRPPTSFTTPLKKKLLIELGLDTSTSTMAKYELDHDISIELGGAPRDPQNLWVEPWHYIMTTNVASGTTEDLGAHSKDKVENYLKRQVCNHAMTLEGAQDAIKGPSWIDTYRAITQ